MNYPANLQLSPEEMLLVLDPGWILTKNSVMGKVVGLMGGLSTRYREIWGDATRGADGTYTVDAVRGADATYGAGAIRGAGSLGIEPGNVKISRGENYRGLPWVMLDYPRVFGREDVLAIRTFFWWGHSFSVTLHLKGTYQRLYLPVIRSRRLELAAAGFHVGVSDDEWRHEHTPEVFAPMDDGALADGTSADGASADARGTDTASVDGVLAGARGAEGTFADGTFVDGALADGIFGARDFFKLSAAVGLDRWEEAPELLPGMFATLVGLLTAV